MTSFYIYEEGEVKESAYLTKNSSAGWYVDDDGDLIYVVDRLSDDRDKDIFAIVVQHDGSSFTVDVDDIEDVLHEPVRTLKTVDIKYTA